MSLRRDGRLDHVQRCAWLGYAQHPLQCRRCGSARKYRHRSARQHLNAGRHTDARADAYSRPDADAHAAAHTDTYACSNANIHSVGHAYANANTDANAGRAMPHAKMHDAL